MGLTMSYHAPTAAHRAREPFQFWSCIDTGEPLGKQARDAEELLTLVEEAPPECLVHHMQTCALRRPQANGEAGEPVNDLAAWISDQVGDTVLAARLAHLDSFAYPDVERLRLTILKIMADHLQWHPRRKNLRGREPLKLFCSRVMEENLHREAWTLEEFRDALFNLEMGSVYLHACRARLRRTRERDDFSHWLGDPEGLELPQLAAQVQFVSRLGGSLQQKQQRILLLCDLALGLT